MSIDEFKNKVDLIIRFSNMMDREDIPNDVKKSMLKIYANTLKINLSDSMIRNIIEYTCTRNGPAMRSLSAS